MALDPLAERGFAARADLYERSRPGWPDAGLRQVMTGLGLGPPSTVVDLGAGTGKLARQLVPLVRRVVAVEPSAGMRAELARAAPGAEAIEGAAEAIPLADGSVDAVLVAEAFHWFSTKAAVAEIARVVGSGGGVALMWNVHDWGDEPWLREVGPLLAERGAAGVRPENRYASGLWRRAFDGSPFGPLEELQVRHEMRVDLEGLVAHISTWSFVGALGDADRTALLDDVRDALQRLLPDPGDVVIPYRTDMYWARRA
jgi:SAM-dependent methyltransferase